MAPPSRLVVAAAIAGATAYVAYEAYADSKHRRQAKEEVEKRDEGVKKAIENHTNWLITAVKEGRYKSVEDARLDMSGMVGVASDLLIHSLTRLKGDVDKALEHTRSAESSLLRVPVFSGTETSDAVVLAALLLWGDWRIYTKAFEGPFQRYLANQGPSSTRVFDLSVCASFGFILSTLSHESARVLHGWLESMARSTTPGSRVGDLELCGDTLAELLMVGLEAEKQAQNKKEGESRLFFKRYTTVNILSDKQMEALNRTLEPCGLYLCFADRFERWALWPETMEGSITTVRVLPKVEVLPAYSLLPPDLQHLCRDYVRHEGWRKLQVTEQEGVRLANFDIRKGYDCACVCNPETGAVTYVEDAVSPLVRKARKNKPSRPQSYIPAKESALGCLIVSRWAAELLKFISVECLRGCSLEHCQVMSGQHMMVAELRKHRGSTDAIDILQVMRGMDLKLLLDSRDRVVDGLTDRLMDKLPGPPEAVDPFKAVKAEVDAFVSDFLRVLEMKLLSTPLNARKEVPADVVRLTGVRANAVKSILKDDGSLTTNLLMVVRDIQRVRDEQLGTVTAVPPNACVAIAVLLFFTVLSVLLADKPFLLLLAALIQRCLPHYTHFVLPYFRSPVFHTTIQLLTLVHISHVTYHTYGCRDLHTYRSQIERPVFLLVCRMLNSCGLRSWRLPALSAAEYKEYETRCAAQMRVWGVRTAVRNMQDACARPRIGASEVLRIMDDMARVATNVRVVFEHIEKESVGGGKGGERHEVRVTVEEAEIPVEVTEAVMQTFMCMDVVDDEDKPSAAGGYGDAGTGGGVASTELVYGAVMDLSSAITGAFESAMTEMLMLNSSASDVTRAMEQIEGDRGADVWQGDGSQRIGPDEKAKRATHSKGRGLPFKGRKGAARGLKVHKGKRMGPVSSTPTINDNSNATTEPETSAPAGNASSKQGSLMTSHRLRAGKKRSVDSVLKEHGWTLVRRKTHYVYKRVIRDSMGRSKEQTFTRASTPSVKVSGLLQLRTLRKLEDEAMLTS